MTSNEAHKDDRYYSKSNDRVNVVILAPSSPDQVFSFHGLSLPFSSKILMNHWLWTAFVCRWRRNERWFFGHCSRLYLHELRLWPRSCCPVSAARDNYAIHHIDHVRITPPSLFSGPPNQSTWMFTWSLGMVGKGVLVCCMTSLRKWSIEHDSGGLFEVGFTFAAAGTHWEDPSPILSHTPRLLSVLQIAKEAVGKSQKWTWSSHWHAMMSCKRDYAEMLRKGEYVMTRKRDSSMTLRNGEYAMMSCSGEYVIMTCKRDYGVKTSRSKNVTIFNFVSVLLWKGLLQDGCRSRLLMRALA